MTIYQDAPLKLIQMELLLKYPFAKKLVRLDIILVHKAVSLQSIFFQCNVVKEHPEMLIVMLLSTM